MTIIEMYEKVREIQAANEDYFCIGIRFEDKQREIGEECEWSRHNSDREDERDFPAYGTDEYQEMEVLDGTCAWDLESSVKYPGFGNRIDSYYLDKEASYCFIPDHAYIIAGDKLGRHDDPDHGEILIKDAVVIAQLF